MYEKLKNFDLLSGIMVTDHGIYGKDQNNRKTFKFFAAVFNMIKVLAKLYV